MTAPAPRAPARDGSFDEAFLAALDGYVAALSARVSWRRLRRVPVEALAAGRLRRIRDALGIGANAAGSFLTPSPRHAVELARLTQEDPRAALVYRFACANEAIGEDELAGLLEPTLAAKVREVGLVVRTADGLRATVSLAPYGDRAYVADARGPTAPGEHPVYLGLSSLQELGYCRTRLPAGKRDKALEIGSGTGIVLLELADRYAHWEGAEYDPRGVAFARANARLQGVTHARFYQSDVFSNVRGRFDMILFNPWQPSEGSLPLIERFVLGIPDHLEPDGKVMLLLETARVAGRDLVLDHIAGWLRTIGMSAERQVVSAYRRGGDPPSIGEVCALWIGRGSDAAGTIRTRRDVAWARGSIRRGVLRVTGR